MAPTSAAVKAKAVAAKTPVNIAAQAARNLGGFVPNKIFVGGVPITCTEDQFKSYFEPFGAISKVELHALRGFGYITYESVEAVDACLEKYEDHYLSKKWVEVKRSIPRELIDAYEREQRRLQTEYVASHEVDRTNSVPIESQVKVEPSTSPPATSPWGASPSSAPRKGGATGNSAGNSSSKEPPGTVNLSRIAQLKEMGFSDEVAKRVLSECAWDVNEAIDRLLASGAMDLGGGSSGPEPEDSGLPAAQSTVEVPAVAALASEPPQAAAVNTQEPGHAGGGSSMSNGLNPGLSHDAGTSGSPDDASGGASRSASHSPRTTQPATAEAFPPGIECATSAVLDDGAASPDAGGKDAVSEAEVVAAVGESSGTSSLPRKRVERVMRMWNAEDASQMSVSEGDFVNVWIDTGTDNGWIHAEGHRDAARVGWLPVCVLKQLPDGQRWMRAGQQWKALAENQCSVEEGTVVVVWVSSRTKEGWTYVETEKDGSLQPGWVPVFCLEWNED